MEDLSKEFLDVAKHIMDSRDLIDPVAHKISDIISDTTAIMDAAIEYGKNHNDDTNSDEFYKHPSPKVIDSIKLFAREFRNTDDHYTAILRDRVTELQEACKKYASELGELCSKYAIAATGAEEWEKQHKTIKTKYECLEKDYNSLLTQLNEAKGKLIVAENTARNRELDDTEIQLVNVCRTHNSGYTVIHHKPSGCKDWITLGYDEIAQKTGAKADEIWDRLFND